MSAYLHLPLRPARQLWRGLALALLLASLAVLAWGAWPLAEQQRSLEFPVGKITLAGDTLPEGRRLTLQWPATLRRGDQAAIRLTFQSDPAGPADSIGSTGLYATHTILLDARLDLSGLTPFPPGEIREALLPGRPVAFQWALHPEAAGVYPGTVWLRARAAPQVETAAQPTLVGQANPLPLTAQLIEIHTVSLFGLSGPAARLLGSAGLVAAAGLLFFSRRRLSRPAAPAAPVK